MSSEVVAIPREIFLDVGTSERVAFLVGKVCMPSAKAPPTKRITQIYTHLVGKLTFASVFFGVILDLYS